MAAVGAVGRPLLHLLWVERGLGAGDGGGEEAGGFARDGIGARGIGEVGVEREPERRAGAGGAAAGGDARLVEVPSGGLAANELERTRGVVERTLHGWRDIVGGGLGDETILDRRDRDAALEHFRQHRREAAEASAVLPTAAVDEEQQRRGGGGLCFPKMDELLRMRAVGDVEVRGVGQGWRGEFALRLVGRDVAHIDGAPADLAAVRLEHERPACGERFSFFPIVFHRCALDDEAGVERDPHACTDLADTHGVPLAERFVGGHDRIAAEGFR